MITRRKFLLSTGVFTAGITAFNTVSASTLLMSKKNQHAPVVLATDQLTSDIGLSLQATHTLKKQIPSQVFTSLRHGVHWLDSNKGSCIVCVVDVRHSFMFDEILKESPRTRTLFKGEHYSDASPLSAVRHITTELPVSAGVTAALTTSVGWTDQLMTTLSEVANRTWSDKINKDALSLSANPKQNPANVSLATYVIVA